MSRREGHIRIREGEERCAVCEQPPTLDLTYRCVGCDEEVCALCVILVRKTRERWCPACAPGAG